MEKVEIIETKPVGKVPKRRARRVAYLDKICRAVATLSPQEALHVSIDKPHRRNTIKRRLNKEFPNTEFQLVTRTLNDNELHLYIYHK